MGITACRNYEYHEWLRFDELKERGRILTKEQGAKQSSK
jgi:hypothetical protein